MKITIEHASLSVESVTRSREEFEVMATRLFAAAEILWPSPDEDEPEQIEGIEREFQPGDEPSTSGGVVASRRLAIKNLKEQGRSHDEIARLLSISTTTVKNHMRALREADEPPADEAPATDDRGVYLPVRAAAARGLEFQPEVKASSPAVAEPDREAARPPVAPAASTTPNVSLGETDGIRARRGVVLRMAQQNRSTPDIANAIGASTKTVENDLLFLRTKGLLPRAAP